VVAELSAHGVFREVSFYDAAPDLILTGRVERFFEHDRRKLWTFVPYYSDKLAGAFRLKYLYDQRRDARHDDIA
jgi:hypothetical protein